MRYFAAASVFVALLTFGAGRNCRAEELVQKYSTVVEVQQSGSLTVTETITAIVEGGALRSGIFRDYPTDYRDRVGKPMKIDFVVLETTRDGERVPYGLQRVSNGVRLYLGGPQGLETPGTHTYVLKYRTERQVNFFPDHDEITFNAIGLGWPIEIAAAEVEVRLPAGAPPANISARATTGALGIQGKDYRQSIAADAPLVRFEVTRALAPREGITVVVEWPKGFVREPTAFERARERVMERKDLVIAIAALILSLLIGLTVWLKGRRPIPADEVAPISEPPAKLSPAACRYVRRLDFDGTEFVTSVVSLATGGFLRISRPPAALLLATVDKDKDESALPEEEAVAYLMVRNSDPFPLTTARQGKLRFALEAAKVSLEQQHRQKLSERKQALVVPHILLGAITFLAMLLTRDFAVERLINRDNGIVLLAGSLWLLVFMFLIRRPSFLRRETLNQLEGFKKHLVEGPAPSAETYEKFLPYAVALEAEREWNAKAPPGYSPAWFSGSGSAAGMGEQLAEAMHAAFAEEPEKAD